MVIFPFFLMHCVHPVFGPLPYWLVDISVSDYGAAIAMLMTQSLSTYAGSNSGSE